MHGLEGGLCFVCPIGELCLGGCGLVVILITTGDCKESTELLIDSFSIDASFIDGIGDRGNGLLTLVDIRGKSLIFCDENFWVDSEISSVNPNSGKLLLEILVISDSWTRKNVSS